MVTWNERDDAREAFIAGSSGARRNTGTTIDTRDAFNKGKQSAKEFKRALYRRRHPDKKDKPQWQQNLDKEIKKFGSNVGTMLSDAPKFPKKGIDYLFEQMPSIPKYVGMLAKGITRHGEEVDEAERDYEIPWFKGGNPIAVDRASPAHKFLLDQMEDKDAFREAVGKDRVFWGGLEEMSGDKYDASHPGLIALLNDPSRLDDMDPIRGLNYMRSITGDPSNMGFDEFEALRQSQPKTYGGLDATEIAQKLLPQYRQTAADMYGEGFLGNTAAATYGDTSAVPAYIKQSAGISPINAEIEELRRLEKAGYQDLTPKASVFPDSVFPDDEYTINTGTPFASWADEPQMIKTPEDLVASEPYTWSASDMLPGLNTPFLKNKYFPNRAIEDITREDIRDLNQYEMFQLGYGR